MVETRERSLVRIRMLLAGTLLLCLCAPGRAFGCDRVPAGEALWIRLTAPVSTYSAKAGDPVRAVLTQDLVCDDEVVVPMGTPVEGVVRSRHKVGWGIRHETASLELEFSRAKVRSGAEIALTARVEEVENAREGVHKGVIQGIRSSDTFQGTVNSRLIHLPTWNPYSDSVLIVYKAVFPIFPEPEIYYPAGTDMRLRTTTEIEAAPVIPGGLHESSEPDAAEREGAEELVEQMPVRTMTAKHLDADLVNIVFIGSEEQVKSAFHEAGWNNADAHSKRTWAKNMYALLNNSGYAQQPMMTFYLNGKPEDMNWQKNLNSYGRRDHLRIWKWTATGTNDPVWVSSSTHDTGAVLSVKYEGFVHHIAPDIDDERSTVIRDLNFAGCVKSVSYVARPEMPIGTHNATGDLMLTDGAVAVVRLRDCRPDGPESSSGVKGGAYKPGNHVFRYIRKEILTFRSDIWRANIIYGAYEVGRMTWTAVRKPVLPRPCSSYTHQGCDEPFRSNVTTAHRTDAPVTGHGG
jgi:hypothetical protein